jgi:tRNA threonylcarbamoyladenosine biosynthesis protein TsaB
VAVILNIETATTVCSVSVFNDRKMLSLVELDDGFTHAENLHLFINKVLADAGVKPKALEGVAISKGPGSYTGLRIGTSAAKGLAYALKIPLISVETLQLLTFAAKETGSDARYFCPMIDARRMEVYTSIFDRELQYVIETRALILDEKSVLEFEKYANICFFGDGMEKSREILSGHSSATFLPAIKPSAKYMGELALLKFQHKDFENVAYFEPFYLKEFLAGKKKAIK